MTNHNYLTIWSVIHNTKSIRQVSLLIRWSSVRLCSSFPGLHLCLQRQLLDHFVVCGNIFSVFPFPLLFRLIKYQRIGGVTPINDNAHDAIDLWQQWWREEFCLLKSGSSGGSNREGDGCDGYDVTDRCSLNSEAHHSNDCCFSSCCCIGCCLSWLLLLWLMLLFLLSSWLLLLMLLILISFGAVIVIIIISTVFICVCPSICPSITLS